MLYSVDIKGNQIKWFQWDLAHVIAAHIKKLMIYTIN